MCRNGQHWLWLLGLLLCWGSVGCTQLDMRDDEEPNASLRLEKALRYTHWESTQSDGPDLYLYGQGKGRVVYVKEEKSYPFSWKGEPNGRSIALYFKDRKFQPAVVAVASNYKSLAYHYHLYQRKGHLRAINVLIDSGEITYALVVEVVIIIVVLVVGTNLLILLHRLDRNLKRHIRVRGSDMGYFLRTEKPELVSINDNPPIGFTMKGHLLDAGGITCDIDTAVLIEESESPLFQLRSGTQLRFYVDAKAYEKARS